MTALHKLRTYRDGLVLVEYCRVCSAEGNELLDPCPGHFSDKKIKKALDEKNEADRQMLLKNRAE